MHGVPAAQFSGLAFRFLQGCGVTRQMAVRDLPRACTPDLLGFPQGDAVSTTPAPGHQPDSITFRRLTFTVSAFMASRVS